MSKHEWGVIGRCGGGVRERWADCVLEVLRQR